MKLQEFNVTVVNHRAGALFGPNFVPYSGRIFDMFATQLPRALLGLTLCPTYQVSPARKRLLNGQRA
jgi:hypothetical protein